MMKDQGYGVGYNYDYDVEDGFLGQNYFFDGMKCLVLYLLVECGFECDLKKCVEWFFSLCVKCCEGKV